jgi:putative Holliday junction resolvase
MATTNNGTILALDVGTVRIGVARASQVARLASPYSTILNDTNFPTALLTLIKDEAVGTLVVGLPRNLSGSDTAQTNYVRDFVESLGIPASVAVVYQDEALTSTKAEAELDRRKKPYSKAAVDALAATYILDDYLANQAGL